MNVLLRSLLVAVLLQRPDNVAGQFTASPTCPGDTITFRCTVGGDSTGMTIWRVGGSNLDMCVLLFHGRTASSTCGPGNLFVAVPETGFGTNATSFSSVLSRTATHAPNGTLIECLGPGSGGHLMDKVEESIIHVLGPPSLPNLSCTYLSEDTDGTVSVTVCCTLSGRDSADFYLINITTNDPQPPYGGLLNITTASVMQRKLIGFRTGYEYNITVCGVNCGSQKGSESEPLTITPQGCFLSGWNITLIVIGAVALVVAIVLGIIVRYGGNYCKSLKLHESKPLEHNTTFLLLFASGSLIIIGTLCWFQYEEVSNFPNKSCELPPGLLILTNQYWICFMTLTDVVAVAVFETVCLCCEWYRHKGDGQRLHVVYRLFVVMLCVLYTIGDTLWIVVALMAAIPPSGISASSPLATWQIVLLVIGGILLGIVCVITIFVNRRQWKNYLFDCKFFKLEWWQKLYFYLLVVSLIFCYAGVTLFFSMGVVQQFKPPYGNAFDRCWCGYRDQLVISAFFASILALIYAIAALIFVVHRVKYEKQSSGKLATCRTVVTISLVLLCLSVIGIISLVILAISECCKKNGCTEGSRGGSHEEVELLHFEPTANEEDEGGDEGGGDGQEYCLVQQSRAVPNPCDPSYSHLKEDVSLLSAEKQKKVKKGRYRNEELHNYTSIL